MITPLSKHLSIKETKMAKVLATIVHDKSLWVSARKKEQPLAHLKIALSLTEHSLSDRSFYDALNTNQTAFILECKKASPSKGLIRSTFNLDEIATVYRQHANVISVLTDEKYFQGKFEFIEQVRSQVSQPVMCKDFIIDTYQIYLARYYGADAILLMLSVLNDQQYQEFAETAHHLNMGILTEVSNEEELQRAIKLGAKVVGINNRDLRDLSTDLNRTKHLAPLLSKDTIIISESGFYTYQQIRSFTPDVNGFLIGSALMAEEDLMQAVRRITLGENKVCGLTHPNDAQKAYQVGAIFGGLIFVKASPRFIDINTAHSIMASAPLLYVGVFQNHSIDFVVSTAAQLNLHAVQLHGDENQAYVDELRTRLLPSIQIWKAYGVKNQLPLLLQQHVDRHLLDAKVDSQLGGTGHCFDWTLLNSLNHRHNMMLAGGLSAENAQQAASLGFIGLDFNSGVEKTDIDEEETTSDTNHQTQGKPNSCFQSGRKDLQKLALTFAAIRQY